MRKKRKAKFGAGFQKQIVACFTQHAEFAARFKDLITEDVIDDPDLATVVAATRTIVTTTGGHLPTRASLEHKCPKQKLVIRDLFAVDTRDRDFVADEIATFARQKACETATLEAAKLVKKGEPGGIPELFQTALMVGHDISNLGEYLKDHFDERASEYLYPEQDTRVPTGLTHLDQLLGGGLGGGELGVLAGAAKSGKSFGLVNFAYGAASVLHGKRVVIYSLEMKQRRILRRLDQRIVGECVELAKSNDVHERRKFVSVLRDRMMKLIAGNILVKSWPTRTATYSMLAAHLARTIALGYRPAEVIVDYGDIMKPERRLGEARHEQASCFEDLRKLAGEFNLPVWTATQLNRAAFNKDTPDMSDVAESFEKVQIADAIIGIGRRKDEAESNEARLITMGLREEKSHQIIKIQDIRRRALWRTLEIVNPNFNTEKERKSPESKQDAAIKRAKEKARGRQEVEEES